MGLAVMVVARSPLIEVPLLVMTKQVVADCVELSFTPPAGHDAQRPTQLRAQPRLNCGNVTSRDNKNRLALAGMEESERDSRSGFSQVTKVIREFDVAPAHHRRPAPIRWRARRTYPRMPPGRLSSRGGLFLDHQLLPEPHAAQEGPAFHVPVPLETVTERSKVGANDPDGTRAPRRPHVMLPTTWADHRQRGFEPLTRAVKNQAPRGLHLIAVSHHKSVNVHPVK